LIHINVAVSQSLAFMPDSMAPQDFQAVAVKLREFGQKQYTAVGQGYLTGTRFATRSARYCYRAVFAAA
jgi:hypothetical protein